METGITIYIDPQEAENKIEAALSLRNRALYEVSHSKRDLLIASAERLEREAKQAQEVTK